MIPLLAEHHRVIAPDLRGAGWTDAPAHGYTEGQLVADVVALLDALGIERVDLVGLDIGGILGFRVCLAHPERVRRFVVMGAPHPYPAVSGRLLVQVLLNAWRLWPRFVVTLPVLGPLLVSRGRQQLPRHMLLAEAPDRGVWSAEDIEAYLGRLRDPARAHAAVALYRALALTASNRAARGAYRGTRLVTPTLGLYGAVLVEDDRDAEGHPRLLLGYERYADDVRMVRVAGTGYYLAEERPEVVARHVLEFFGHAYRAVDRSIRSPERVWPSAPPGRTNLMRACRRCLLRSSAVCRFLGGHGTSLHDWPASRRLRRDAGVRRRTLVSDLR